MIERNDKPRSKSRWRAMPADQKSYSCCWQDQPCASVSLDPFKINHMKQIKTQMDVNIIHPKCHNVKTSPTRAVECNLGYGLHKVYSYSSQLSLHRLTLSCALTRKSKSESTKATFMLRLEGQAGEVEVTTW